MFRLLTHSDGPFMFSLDEKAGSDARFTVILGPNGTGKSQLLRSIAESHRLPRSRPDESRSELEHGPAHTPPRSLLVLSNMVMDVFTNTTKDRGKYRYLGLRQASNNSSTGSLRDATAGALLTCFGDPHRSQLLGPVLSALGTSTCLVSFDTPHSRTKDNAPDIQIVERFLNGLDATQERSHFTSAEALTNEANRFRERLVRDGLPMDLDSPEILDFWDIAARFELEATDLIRLVKRLGIAEVRVHLKFQTRLADLDSLSAGQLLLLSTFARIAANVRPDSLVIIDEPETGLHPNWQSAWIPVMRDTIPSEFGCHLFLATHSPYLVADADDVLVPGAEWGEFRQYDEPFQGRSVENILYRVFGARVAGNLMVEADLTTLVEQISRPSRSHANEADTRSALARLQAFRGDDTPDLNAIIDQATRLLG